MSLASLEHLSYAPVAPRMGMSPWRRVEVALKAGCRAGELDRDLAAGASPTRSPLHAVRAGQLTRRRNRARVADGLARVIRDADTPAPGFGAAARPDRREVRGARTVLAALERRVRAPEPVTTQGMALLQALLTDGTSPLYQPTEAGALGSRLRGAAAALEPFALFLDSPRQAVAR